MKLFDAHCHIQMSQYDADREAVLARMQEKGVGALVVGVDYETSKAALELAASHDFLWASVGLHPNDPVKDAELSHGTGNWIGQFEELAKDPKVVAIGECGLDYYRSGGTPEEKAAQRERFEAQIELATRLNKTLVVHCRDAHDDCSNILQKYGIATQVPVVIHFFTGAAELAKRYLDLGCYLSFPGPITYTDRYDESIRACPLDRLLIETDAPFAAPVPHRGKRNEPAFVEFVAAKVAAVAGLELWEAAEAAVQNARAVFNLR